MRQHSGGDAGCFVIAGFAVDAGGGQQQFARVDEILVVGIAVEIVPSGVFFETEKGDVVHHVFAVVVQPGLAVHHRRDKRFD